MQAAGIAFRQAWRRAAPGPRAAMLLRTGVGLLLLTALWHALDGAAALDRLAAADPGWLAAAVVALSLQTVASALRWRLTAARLGQAIAPGRAVSEYFLAQLVNQTLPGGVLGDAGRAVRTRHEAGLVSAGQAVMLERFAGQLALLAVMAAGLALTAAVPGGVTWPEGTGDAVRAGALALAAGAAALAALTRLPGRLARAGTAFGRAAQRALFAREVWPRQAALSLATVACNLAAFAFCARATGTPLPVAATAAVVPLILLSMLIPLSIGGWGFREGASAALWPILGATAEAGVAASVAFGVVLVVASLPGVVPLIVGRVRAAGAAG